MCGALGCRLVWQGGAGPACPQRKHHSTLTGEQSSTARTRLGTHQTGWSCGPCRAATSWAPKRCAPAAGPPCPARGEKLVIPALPAPISASPACFASHLPHPPRTPSATSCRSSGVPSQPAAQVHHCECQLTSPTQRSTLSTTRCCSSGVSRPVYSSMPSTTFTANAGWAGKGAQQRCLSGLVLSWQQDRVQLNALHQVHCNRTHTEVHG